MTVRVRPVFAALALAFAASSANAATTLTVASFPSFDIAVKEAIAEWKKIHPDVEIKLISREYGDHHTAMTTALASGTNLPDVMGVEFGYVGRFVEGGGMEDLNKAPYNAGQYKDKFVKYTYPQATSSSGVLGVMPADIGPGSLFYRKDLMDKAGVTEADLTKSWESYIEAGKKLKASTGAFLLPDASAIMNIYIRSNLKDGDGLYFDKSKKPQVDSARFQKAFELAKAVRTAGIDAKVKPWTNEWAEGFKRGTIASEMMGAWLGGHLNNWLAPDTKGKWRAADLPNGAFASWGGSFYGIPKKAANKEMAWGFIKFMTLRKDIQILSFNKLDAFPALLEAQNDPFFEQPIEFLGGQKARPMWRSAAAKIPSMPVDKFDPVAAEVIEAELEKVLTANKDIKAALADAKTGIERRVRR